MKTILLWGLVLATFTLGRAQAPTQFTEVAQSAGIVHQAYNVASMAGASAWFDYDGDGDEDLMLTGGDLGNVLYRNDGNGNFTDVTVAAGISIPDGTSTQGIVTGDIDNDGFRELFITTWWHQGNYLYKNNGDGTFTDISVASGLGLDSVWTSSSAFGDFDRDGWLDLYCGNYVYYPQVTVDSAGNYTGYAHRCDANALWHNNGDGTFTNVAPAYAVGDTGCALATIFTDYDQDGDPDLWVANDFGAWVAPNALFRNDGPQFADVSASAGINAGIYGMGFAVADYDHDLDLDYYVTNIGANLLHQNQGNGTFQPMAAPSGVLGDSMGNALSTGWGTMFMDIDHDGWQDLFCANGYIELIPIFENAQQDPDRLWHNNGDGTFSDVTFDVQLGDTAAARGASACDYDQDGDMDLFVNIVVDDTLTSPHHARLYRNDLNSAHHWLQVRLEGVWSNRDAYGSLITVFANGSQWVHEVRGGSSHMSQSSTTAHFGLGNATQADSLVIRWPSGIVQTVVGLTGDSLWHVVEDTTLLVVEPAFEPEVRVVPHPFAGAVRVDIELAGAEPLQASLYDLEGRKIRGWASEAAVVHVLEWDGSIAGGNPLPAGMYLLWIQTPSGSHAVRLLKQP